MLTHANTGILHISCFFISPGWSIISDLIFFQNHTNHTLWHAEGIRLIPTQQGTRFNIPITWFQSQRCSFLFFCLGFPRSDCVETQFCYRKTSTVKSISWCFEKSTQVNNNCPTVCIRLCSLCKWTTTLQHCRMSTWECVQEQQLFYVFSVRHQCPTVSCGLCSRTVSYSEIWCRTFKVLLLISSCVSMIQEQRIGR